MSTRKLSDKEFDRYTKNLLKKSEGVAYDKAAWAAMEQQLAQAGAAPSIFNLKWIIPLGIIILSGVLYLVFQSIGAQNATSDTSANLENVSENLGEEWEIRKYSPDSLVMADKSYETQTIDQTENENVATEIIEEEKSFMKAELGEGIAKTESSEGFIEKGKENNSENKNRTIAKPIEVVAPTSEAFDKVEKNVYTGVASEQVGEKDKNLVSPNKTNNLFQKQNEQNPVPQDIEPIPIVFYSIPIEEKEPDLTYIEVSYGISKQDSSSFNEDESLSFKKWSIGLTLAPDFSTVGKLNEFTQPGIDFGFTIEYYITKRLSISSGAILTRKLYNTTDISEYTIPSGFWNGAGAPEEIGADCRVIDIPINLRYLLTEGQKTSLFFSAGMSSYLMLSEIYDYSYADGQYTGSQPTGWEVSNENNHFFGVYNISAVLSRRISRDIYVEAEPFLKNSLGGVGWGQVSLKSTGLLFHIKYNF